MRVIYFQKYLTFENNVFRCWSTFRSEGNSWEKCLKITLIVREILKIVSYVDMKEGIFVVKVKFLCRSCRRKGRIRILMNMNMKNNLRIYDLAFVIFILFNRPLRLHAKGLANYINIIRNWKEKHKIILTTLKCKLNFKKYSDYEASLEKGSFRD